MVYRCMVVSDKCSTLKDALAASDTMSHLCRAAKNVAAMQGFPCETNREAPCFHLSVKRTCLIAWRLPRDYIRIPSKNCEIAQLAQKLDDPAVFFQTVSDFQRAAARAQSEMGERWWQLQPAEQTAAIYSHLRLLDAARAKAMKFRPGRPGRFRIAGEPTRRETAAD